MTTAKKKQPESFADYVEKRTHLHGWKLAGSKISVQAGPARIRLEAGGDFQQRMEIAAMIEQAPEMFASLQSFFANWPTFDPSSPEYDTEVSGADVVDWLNEQAPYWHAILKKATVRK
jgi:hypothetical protein